MVTPERLRRCPLFQHLSNPHLTRLGRVSSLEHYHKGAVILRQGQRAKFIWIILRGWVHLARAAHHGAGSRATVLFTVTPQEALCGISALDSGVYNMSALAGMECVTLRIPIETFKEVLLREPAFCYAMLRLCTRRVQKIADQYGAVAEPVAHRLTRSILRLQDQFGPLIPMTHRELAQMSWTTTESAIRVVRQLKRQGVVSGRRGQLMILKAAALRRMLEPAQSHVVARPVPVEQASVSTV